MTYQFIIIIISSLSIALNAYLLFRLKNKIKKTESYEVKHLLADLAQGGALVEIRRLDPHSVFLRSPRELN